jgi:hypothetical protein
MREGLGGCLLRLEPGGKGGKDWRSCAWDEVGLCVCVRLFGWDWVLALLSGAEDVGVTCVYI